MQLLTSRVSGAKPNMTSARQSTRLSVIPIAAIHKSAIRQAGVADGRGNCQRGGGGTLFAVRNHRGIP